MYIYIDNNNEIILSHYLPNYIYKYLYIDSLYNYYNYILINFNYKELKFIKDTNYTDILPFQNIKIITKDNIDKLIDKYKFDLFTIKEE